MDSILYGVLLIQPSCQHKTRAVAAVGCLAVGVRPQTMLMLSGDCYKCSRTLTCVDSPQQFIISFNIPVVWRAVAAASALAGGAQFPTGFTGRHDHIRIVSIEPSIEYLYRRISPDSLSPQTPVRLTVAKKTAEAPTVPVHVAPRGRGLVHNQTLW